MDAAKKADGLAELAAFVDENKRVTVGGTEYELAKLRPIDLAEARNWIVKKRSEHLLETFRNTPIDPASFGAALAAIECTPLSVFEVTHHASGRLKLIHLSLTRAGGSMTLKGLEQNLEPLSQDKLYAYCMWISGCLDSPEPSTGDDDAPLSTPAVTTSSSL